MQAAEFTRETDCLLEEAGFEPSIPSQMDDAFEDAFSACVALPRFAKDRLLRERYRRFESVSLRQPVCLTREPPGNMRKPRGFGRGLPGEWDVRGRRRVPIGLI